MGIWEPVSHRKAVKVEKGHAAGSFRTRRSSHLAEEGMRRESGGAVQAGFVILSEMALMTGGFQQSVGQCISGRRNSVSKIRLQVGCKSTEV